MNQALVGFGVDIPAARAHALADVVVQTTSVGLLKREFSLASPQAERLIEKPQGPSHCLGVGVRPEISRSVLFEVSRGEDGGKGFA